MKPDRETLYQLYIEERLSARAIAERYAVRHISVLRWLQSYGIERRSADRGLRNRGIAAPTRDELVDLVHSQHLSYREIALRYGVDYTAIPHWLKKHGIAQPTVWNTRRKGDDPILPTRDELHELYASGLSLDQIGALYGVSAKPIRQLCRACGIVVRHDGWNEGTRLICADGHKVRSTYELRVDNWLSEHGIEHIYEPALPDPHYHADFLANGWYIEVWGVAGLAYAERKQRKLALYQKYQLPLIEITRHMFTAARTHHWQHRLEICLDPPNQAHPE